MTGRLRGPARQPPGVYPVARAPLVFSGMGWTADQNAALIALFRAKPPPAKWDHITETVAQLGDPIAALHQFFPDSLLDVESRADALLDAARADLARWLSAPYRFLSFADEEYPRRLRDVRQMPPFLFAKGELLHNDRGISVVGSRDASDAATQFARDVSTGLVDCGITVVSGLALGIDSAAHRAALDAGGRTVAVIGSGMDRPYPTENRDLLRSVAETGLVLSQFFPDFSPTRWSFPVRNATMSAYGYATIIVAAGEQSGTRVQAREAVAHGRPVVLTTQVAHGTNWGSDLIGQPRVSIASTADQAVALAVKVVKEDLAVSRWLQSA